MLITNAEQAAHAGISLKMTCVYCRKPIITYPFYVADDCYLTKYHMTCATQLAMDVLDDASFVIEQLPKAQIKQTQKREQIDAEESGTAGTTAMARAFRKAAKERKQEPPQPPKPDNPEESGTSAMAQAFREAAIQSHEAEIEGVPGT